MCALVWRHPAHQQEHRAVHLLSADRNSGRPAQGPPAGDHRHNVGELPVHPAGRAGTGLCGNPGFGDRRHSCPVLLSRPPQPAAGHVQSVGQRHFDCHRLQRLPPGDLRGASEGPPPAAGVGRNLILRRQHRLDRSRDRAHRTQVHQEPVGGMLLLVVPVLPGGRRLCRNDRLVQPRIRLGDFSPHRSRHISDLPLLSPIPGAPRGRKAPRRRNGDLHLRTIEALALAIEAKDHTTHDHLQRVQVYAIEMGKEMG